MVLGAGLALCSMLDFLCISHWNFTAEKTIAGLVKRTVNSCVLLPTAEWIHCPSCPQSSCPGQLSCCLLHGSSGGGEWGMPSLTTLTAIWDCASSGCCTTGTWSLMCSVPITENFSTMSNEGCCPFTMTCSWSESQKSAIKTIRVMEHLHSPFSEHAQENVFKGVRKNLTYDWSQINLQNSVLKRYVKWADW